jgi:hypothetical protein
MTWYIIVKGDVSSDIFFFDDEFLAREAFQVFSGCIDFSEGYLFKCERVTPESELRSEIASYFPGP